MKRISLFLAATMLLVVGCKSPEKDYKALIDQKINSFQEYCDSISTNPSLDGDEIEILLEAQYERTVGEITEIAEEGLVLHTDDSIAVELIKTLVMIEAYDSEQTVEKIASMGPTVQNNSDIQQIRKAAMSTISSEEGKMFKDFAIVQPDGEIARLSDYAGKGKYCLVDFWASWCGPCKKEIPNLIKVYDKFHRKGLEIVSVAVWDDADATVAAAREHGIKWHQIINAQDIPGELYGIQSIPQIMLIGPDGTILKRGLRGDRIEEEIGKYL